MSTESKTEYSISCELSMIAMASFSGVKMGEHEMTGSGIHSAADYLDPYIRSIDPQVAAICAMPIEKYGLSSPKVLNAIARVAGATEKDSFRTYDRQGKVKFQIGKIETLDDLLRASYAAKLTFNVEYLERHIPEINAFAIDLSALYGGTVSVHAFVSAGGVPATPLHYDYSDAYTHQIYGRKWWRCYEYKDVPRYGPEGYQINQSAVGAITVDRVLVEGDCLFVPMGGLHLVQSQPDSDSVHLAVSVKPLGFHRFMAEAFGPQLDQPRWTGLNFQTHVQKLARQLLGAAEAASRGDVVSRARNAVWQHIYESYLRAPYPLPSEDLAVEGSDAQSSHGIDSRPWKRRLGRPVGITYGESTISLDFIDPALSGTVGRFEFSPSRVELPAKARPFAEMLARGDLDESQLRDSFDQESVVQLIDIATQMGLTE